MTTSMPFRRASATTFDFDPKSIPATDIIYLYVRFDDDLFSYFVVFRVTTEVDSLLCLLKWRKTLSHHQKSHEFSPFFSFWFVVFWLLFASELFSLSLTLSLHFSLTHKNNNMPIIMSSKRVVRRLRRRLRLCRP